MRICQARVHPAGSQALDPGSPKALFTICSERRWRDAAHAVFVAPVRVTPEGPSSPGESSHWGPALDINMDVHNFNRIRRPKGWVPTGP